MLSCEATGLDGCMFVKVLVDLAKFFRVSGVGKRVSDKKSQITSPSGEFCGGEVKPQKIGAGGLARLACFGLGQGSSEACATPHNGHSNSGGRK